MDVDARLEVVSDKIRSGTPAGDALHTAVCNAVTLLNNGEEVAPRVSAILREALFNWNPTETARAIQAGKGEVTDAMVWRACEAFYVDTAWKDNTNKAFDFMRIALEAAFVASPAGPVIEPRDQDVELCNRIQHWLNRYDTEVDDGRDVLGHIMDEIEAAYPTIAPHVLPDLHDAYRTPATTPAPAAPDGDAPLQRWTMKESSDGSRHFGYMDHDERGGWVKWSHVQQAMFGAGLAALSDQRVSEADGGTMRNCPGCGCNDCRVIGGPGTAGGPLYWAGCMFCRWRTWGNTEHEAITAWNTRHLAASVAEVCLAERLADGRGVHFLEWQNPDGEDALPVGTKLYTTPPTAIPDGMVVVMPREGVSDEQA